MLRVGNKSQNWARAVIEVVVSFEADVRQAREIMRSVAEELAADPEWSTISAASAIDEQGISALTPLGVTLRLVVDVEPASQWRIERELRLRIKEAFDANGVPFEVHHP
jgi:small conductance mechanosensitive channel